jgi:uncharacterized protein (TIGR03000 family)
MYSLLLMTAMAGGADVPQFHGRLFGGCQGSAACYGSSCNGCWGGSCHGGGLFGHRAGRASGCYGSSCNGCYGSSCHGSSCHGCWGSSCHGCVGSIGGSGIWYSESAVITMPAVGTAKLEEDEQQSANITVELPAGSKLYVDGNLVTGEETVRHFHTPALARGKQYYYTMKAEVTVAGKPVVEEKQIVVRAGERVTEKFEKLSAAAKVASAGSSF